MPLTKAKKSRLTTYILVGLILGLITGYICFKLNPLEADRIRIAGDFSIISTVFLHLIKMIVSPLVLTSLIVGIAKMGDIKAIGRIGLKTLSWFMFASILSLTLGLIMVSIFRPGDAMAPLIAHLNGKLDVSPTALSFRTFLIHMFPTSLFDSMAKNEILQIVIFAMFFGVALSGMGTKAEKIIDLIDTVFHAMLKVTGFIMNLAPLAVFAAVSGAITQHGIEVVGTYGIFMGEFYLSVVVLWLVLIGLGWLILGSNVFGLIKMVRSGIILAFSTASSESAYPKILESLEQYGVSNKTASFVLPIGYSFNLDGSMIYCTFATIFIAQAYGVHLSFVQQITMLAILMLTSKGMAGVPRASLVVIAATLIQFNIPEAGLLLLLAVDHFLDMARSATNVVGNTIAAAIVAKWEGELDVVNTEESA